MIRIMYLQFCIVVPSRLRLHALSFVPFGFLIDRSVGNSINDSIRSTIAADISEIYCGEIEK